MIRKRSLRRHLRTSPDYALASNDEYLDREIQDPRNSARWIRDCAAILVEVRTELSRRLREPY